jgi:hypothetical protein
MFLVNILLASVLLPVEEEVVVEVEVVAARLLTL